MKKIINLYFISFVDHTENGESPLISVQPLPFHLEITPLLRKSDNKTILEFDEFEYAKLKTVDMRH